MRDLSGFTGAGYDKGRSRLWQAAWLAVQGALLQYWWCPAKLRIAALRFFGATIGEGCLVRHRVRIHWPWKLTLGDNVWIGEQAWLLNLEPITIGSNTCISQDVFVCTGSHQFHDDHFEFDNAPITVGERCWLAARSTVLRGVSIGDGSVVGAGALVVADVPAGSKVFAPLGAPTSLEGRHA